jgi:hypothetical protein
MLTQDMTDEQVEAQRAKVRRSYAKHKGKYRAAHRERMRSDPVYKQSKRKNYDNWVRNNPASYAIKTTKSNAKANGRKFELDVDWYTERFEKGCAVTGIAFDPHRSDSPWVAHIDRIDSSGNYTKDNCRLVCACYNLAKKHWTDADVLRMAKALVRDDT